MAVRSVYIRVDSIGPLKKFARDNKTSIGTAISDLVELQLKKEGYL